MKNFSENIVQFPGNGPEWARKIIERHDLKRESLKHADIYPSLSGAQRQAIRHQLRRIEKGAQLHDVNPERHTNHGQLHDVNPERHTNHGQLHDVNPELHTNHRQLHNVNPERHTNHGQLHNVNPERHIQPIGIVGDIPKIGQSLIVGLHICLTVYLIHESYNFFVSQVPGKFDAVICAGLTEATLLLLAYSQFRQWWQQAIRLIGIVALLALGTILISAQAIKAGSGTIREADSTKERIANIRERLRTVEGRVKTAKLNRWQRHKLEKEDGKLRAKLDDLLDRQGTGTAATVAQLSLWILIGVRLLAGVVNVWLSHRVAHWVRQNCNSSVMICEKA